VGKFAIFDRNRRLCLKAQRPMVAMDGSLIGSHRS